jgi:P-type Ca2+ transporter type 2C
MTRTATKAPPAHALPAAEVTQRLDVDAREGLPSGEAARRLGRDGPNRLAEARLEPRWRAFLRQFQDLLIIILLIAAVVSWVVTREWETPVVIALVVLLNATVGFAQESKAEASLEALKKMLVTTATVRRDGRMVNLDAAELVAGDVVALQPGDRVPADGRLTTHRARGAGVLAHRGGAAGRQVRHGTGRPGRALG